MICDNLKFIRNEIESAAEKCSRDPAGIKLVAVSKRFPVEKILEAREAGQYLFGENYIQEAAAKRKELSPDINLHFIGHLQSNKAKAAAEIFSMIETVDRYKIASALNKHLLTVDRKLDILVQVNIGHDPQKAGLVPEHTEGLLKEIRQLSQLKVRGLMTMPPFHDDPEESRPYFRALRLLSEQLRNKGLLSADAIELSMGMSNDFQIAIEEGATIIRVGTAIFGSRPSPASG